MTTVSMDRPAQPLSFRRNLTEFRRPVGEIPVLALIETFSWSLTVRFLISFSHNGRTLAVLDRLPRWHLSSKSSLPIEYFRIAGTCLGQSIACSQYLRQRKVPHTIVIGVRREDGRVVAHAWVDPIEPSPTEFQEIRRIVR